MSNTMYEDQPQAAPQSTGNTRGCLFGCLVAVGLVFGAVLCTGIGGYWFFTSQVEKYTADAPLDLPQVEYAPEELSALQDRLKSFETAVEGGEISSQEMELSADDINALIANEKTLKGKVFVRIADGQVTGDVSVPADMVPGGSERYFNGSATLDASMESGVLIVTLVDAEVNGEKLPQKFIDAMAQENLAKEMYKNPENAKTMRRFKDIRIEGDKVILTLKPTEKTDAAEVESGEETATPALDELDDLDEAAASDPDNA
ncbi:hypothetical protein [Planctomycetes bacterium K23_9]|uniref:Uncharacterized protein n=1 Tax=Stieleria marina TaxID=1930275 RepID=A0A517NPL2_9BACT|nr:hypothetical protein K239x_10010 [Planctomycetes bacterium K23_9]